MLFGRVKGMVQPEEHAGQTWLRLTVLLETAARIETVREELLPPLRPISGQDDLIWHADQWTQETIGNELAEAGWEVIGAGDLPSPDPNDPDAIPRSATYAVRRL